MEEQILQLQNEVKELQDQLSLLLPDSSIFINNEAVVDADITISTVIPGTGGTVNHLDFPDRWLIKRQGTNVYMVPVYNFTRK